MSHHLPMNTVRLRRTVKRKSNKSALIRNIVFDAATAELIDQESERTGVAKSEIVRRLVLAWGAHQPAHTILPAVKKNVPAAQTEYRNMVRRK